MFQSSFRTRSRQPHAQLLYEREGDEGIENYTVTNSGSPAAGGNGAASTKLGK